MQSIIHGISAYFCTLPHIGKNQPAYRNDRKNINGKTN